MTTTTQQQQSLLSFTDETLKKFNGILITRQIFLDLHGVIQPPIHHPEGDVFEHTRQVVLAMHLLIKQEIMLAHRKMSKNRILRLFWAAILHDVGKVSTTVTTPSGKITAHGHERVSADMSKNFFAGLLAEGFFGENQDDTNFFMDDSTFKNVFLLVKNHMKQQEYMIPLNEIIKKWVFPFRSVEVAEDLFLLMIADKSGRNVDGQVKKFVVPLVCKEYLEVINDKREEVEKKLVEMMLEASLSPVKKPKRVMPFYDGERLKKEFGINPKRDVAFIPIIKKFFEEVRKNELSEVEERELILLIFQEFLVHDDQARPDDSHFLGE